VVKPVFEENIITDVMPVIELDIAVIGAGPAGMAAGLSAWSAGCRKIVIFERDSQTGGILQQCIHNGFGLHYFKEELTGPEYAARFADKLAQTELPVMSNTMVIDLTTSKKDGLHYLTVVSPDYGLRKYCAKSVILAMGCRERPRGALGIPGTRCAGIMTTGTAQRLVNREGLLPGKRIVILGSGDIGLIMARRMTFEGAKVLACVELMPFSSGLTRNVVQCLHDFDIPLLLSHTVVDIDGKDRLRSVTIAQVDPVNKKPVKGTERKIECDTLLLSAGLIPENELSRQSGVKIDPETQGPLVDQHMATSQSGIFACGNVLHVHDLVDFVSEESELAGRSAWRYCQSANAENGVSSTMASDNPAVGRIMVKAGSGVRAIVPQMLACGSALDNDLKLSFRPDQVYRQARVKVRYGDKVIYNQKKLVLTPGEMVTAIVKSDMIRQSCNSLIQSSVSEFQSEKAEMLMISIEE
jgi:sarcosine oxidase subunit alpha